MTTTQYLEWVKKATNEELLQEYAEFHAYGAIWEYAQHFTMPLKKARAEREMVYKEIIRRMEK